MTNQSTGGPTQPRIETQYCFGGTRECSGCNPCPACAHWLNMIVIPMALERLGIEIDAEAFVREGLAPGYARLHWLINNDPNVRSQITVMRSQARSGPAQQRAAEAAPKQVEITREEFEAADPEAFGAPPAWAAALTGKTEATPAFTAEEVAEAEERKATGKVTASDVGGVIERRQAPMARPMTAEEIAASGRKPG